MGTTSLSGDCRGSKRTISVAFGYLTISDEGMLTMVRAKGTEYRLFVYLLLIIKKDNTVMLTQATKDAFNEKMKEIGKPTATDLTITKSMKRIVELGLMEKSKVHIDGYKLNTKLFKRGTPCL